MRELSVVGKSVPRIDSRDKATGKAMYTADFKMPRMLYGIILGSPYPHARITRIDTSKAEKVPGVRAVITARDVPQVRGFSEAVEDQYILPCDNIVRKVDDPVAAVAAETIEAAEEAIECIEVDYEELPPVLTLDEAHSKNPPSRVHPDFASYTYYPPSVGYIRFRPEESEEKPNVCGTYRIKMGNLDKGFKEADVIIENTFETVRAHHCAIEPPGCICWIDADGVANVISSTQSIFGNRQTVARLFRMPENKFRYIGPWVGGSFGGKYGPKDDPIGIILAQKTGRPVKLIKSRREYFTNHETRLHIKVQVKDGYKKDGTIVARQIELELDLGAYSQLGGGAIKTTSLAAVGSYRIPNFRLEATGYYTNLPKSSAMRGIGTPELLSILEQQMDMAAERLNIDPVTIRKKNMLKKGDVDVCGQVMRSTGALGCLERAAKEIGIDEKIVQATGPWKRGRGIALGNKYTEVGTASSVTVKVFADGMVEVGHNAATLGQGSHSCLAQMAAEEFGLPLENIRLVRGDTANTPYDAGSWDSRSIFHSGIALLRACADTKRQMFAIASIKLGVLASELETRGGLIYRKSRPSLSMPISELFTPFKAISGGCSCSEPGISNNGSEDSDFWSGSEILGKGSYIAHHVPEDENGQSPRIFCYVSHIATGIEVAVNEETGEVKVLKAVSVADCGQPINPKSCEQQLDGGRAMGISLALYEEMKFDNGIQVNPSFADYKIPTVMELPIGESSLTFFNHDPFEDGPYGAKGLGELVMAGVEAAVANAIYNAVGIRLPNQPYERERIWKAIREKKSAKR